MILLLAHDGVHKVQPQGDDGERADEQALSARLETTSVPELFQQAVVAHHVVLQILQMLQQMLVPRLAVLGRLEQRRLDQLHGVLDAEQPLRQMPLRQLAGRFAGGVHIHWLLLRVVQP